MYASNEELLRDGECPASNCVELEGHGGAHSGDDFEISIRATVVTMNEVLNERVRQRILWGDEHDDAHTSQDWDRFIRCRLDEFYRDDKDNPEPRRRELLIHIAALCLAALEADARGGLALRT